MSQNPDLLQPANDTGQPQVPALNYITPPMPNTKEKDFVYFVCTLPYASMFRQDGKKLPFVGGYLKTNVKEDIRYLDLEIETGSIYLRRASPKEIEAARMYEDPLGMIKDTVRLEVEKQVRENYTIEQLELLLKEKKENNQKSVEVSSSESPDDKARRLLASIGRSGLKPASTADMGGAVGASNSVAG